MNTKKVQELLQQIEAAQNALAELDKSRAQVEKQIKSQKQVLAGLKRDLAGELRGVVGRPASRRASKFGHRESRVKNIRATGLTKSILDNLGDGKEHTVEELKSAAESAGISAKNIALTLFHLVKKGRVRRVSRGVYAMVVQERAQA